MEEVLPILEAAMACLRGGDNASISKASTYIKSFNNKRIAAECYFTLLCSSTDGLVRQLSGIMLRKKLLAWWNRCTPAGRDAMKAGLLQRVAEDTHTGKPLSQPITAACSMQCRCMIP